jgi:hypothetical protein
MTEARNQYGFPIIDRTEQAKAYAAAVRERNKPTCDCPTCREKELLPAVIQLTEGWVRHG